MATMTTMAVLNMTTMAITNMTTMHDHRNQLNTESSQIMDSTGQKCPKVPPKAGYTRMIFLLSFTLPFTRYFATQSMQQQQEYNPSVDLSARVQGSVQGEGMV